MTRIDFYLLDSDSAGERDLTVCRLAHKAFRLGHRIYMLTSNAEESRTLDRLLWTFSAGSFVPHELNSNQRNPAVRIVIGDAEPAAEFDDVLINLAHEVPPCFSRFQRVAEIVGREDEDKQRAREHFRFYRDRGYPLHTHTLDG